MREKIARKEQKEGKCQSWGERKEKSKHEEKNKREKTERM